MWCGLYHLIATERDGDVSDELMRHSISKVYRSIIQQASEAFKIKSARIRVGGVILRRWMIQLAAIEGDVSSVIKTMRKELQGEPFAWVNEIDWNSLDLELQLRHRFGGSGLVGRLRRFKPYGGEQEVPFAKLGSEGQKDKILDAFMACWKERDPSTQDRLRLILRLWAGSAHFHFQQLLIERSTINE